MVGSIRTASRVPRCMLATSPGRSSGVVGSSFGPKRGATDGPDAPTKPKVPTRPGLTLALPGGTRR
eukprot:4599973-Pyramimonas_sp.AAC.1